jgi:hypothetical protein
VIVAGASVASAANASMADMSCSRVMNI